MPGARSPPGPPPSAVSVAGAFAQRRHLQRNEAYDAFDLGRLLAGRDLLVTQKFCQHVVERSFMHCCHRLSRYRSVSSVYAQPLLSDYTRSVNFESAFRANHLGRFSAEPRNAAGLLNRVRLDEEEDPRWTFAVHTCATIRLTTSHITQKTCLLRCLPVPRNRDPRPIRGPAVAGRGAPFHIPLKR